MNAIINLGLVFGDEGKGITTDLFCRVYPLKTTVVRFSGGQQAGHNVKIGDVSHVHSSYGSGTLRGLPSYFTEHCTMYPVNMFNEQTVLNEKGVNPEVYLHPLIMVTTPADVAYNRMIENKLSHGTCGLGVGATMKRNLNTGYKCYGIDLTNIEVLKRKVFAISWYYRQLISNQKDLINFENEYDKELKYFFDSVEKLKFSIVSYDFLTDYENLIFEGSQGIMLDMDHGFFPNVTFANTTSKNALAVCDKIGLNRKKITINYITRCYQTRHGAGWMSNNDEVKLINNEDEINVFNAWQKDFRIGELDYNLLNHSLNIDDIYSHNVKRKSLVITCLDQRPNFEFDYSTIGSRFKQFYYSHSADSKDFTTIKYK